MKNEKSKLKTTKLSAAVEEQVTDKIDTLKKTKINKKSAEKPAAATKIKKSKSEKVVKEMDESTDQKIPKEDKLTKFLVSMNKSVRKSIKKEAAEVGVSMNEYIVLALEKKLGLDTLNRVKASKKAP